MCKRFFLIVLGGVFILNISAQESLDPSSSNSFFLRTGEVGEQIEEGGFFSRADEGSLFYSPEMSSQASDPLNDGWDPPIPDPGGVPIVESILGLLGLGGVYAWRLITRKKKKLIL